MNDQTKAIVAHITIIGWLISLFMNQSENRTPLTSFYLRQLLGLFLAGLILSFSPACTASSSSRVTQTASCSSIGSSTISRVSASPRQPSISEAGKGQGCEAR